VEKDDVAPLGEIASNRLRSTGSRPGPGNNPRVKRPEVEAGPASQDRQTPARVECRGSRSRIARVLGGGVVAGRVSDVDQMVRDCRDDPIAILSVPMSKPL